MRWQGQHKKAVWFYLHCGPQKKKKKKNWGEKGEKKKKKKNWGAEGGMVEQNRYESAETYEQFKSKIW